MKTLVVEDEKLIAEELRAILESLGYEVCATVSSADEAEELLRRVTPDLLLVDIKIRGDRDGIDLVHRVRRTLDAPVVFITSYTDEATVLRAKALRPEGYLVKPITRERVFATLEMATAGWEPADREPAKDEPPIRGPGLASHHLRRVKQLVHERYQEPLSLERLAKVVGTSKFHFCRSFRESTGVTPYQYLLQVRIDRAKRLLTTTESPVSQIATEVGFGSASQFSRAFRRFVGMTPLEYRRGS